MLLDTLLVADGREYTTSIYKTWQQELNQLKFVKKILAPNVGTVKDILNDPVIKSYLPSSFNYSDLATVQYDNITNAIVIRDNDSKQPHVVIIKTSVLHDAPVEIKQQLAYDSSIDY